MIPDALDQSFGYADPDACAEAGIRLVSMYLSHDPSKNSTPTKVRAYHAAGIAVQHNWESYTGRPFLGYDAGIEDGRDARIQLNAIIAEVGYRPLTRLAIPFSVDRDANHIDYPVIDAYFRGVRAALGGEYLVGVYGEADVIEHLHAAGLTAMEWQTIAWSQGRLSPETDLYQYAIDQSFAGASVDFNRIIHADQLGAWWPPGADSPLGGGTEIQPPAPGPAQAFKETDMLIYPTGNPALVLWVAGSVTVQLLDGASVSALRAEGVPFVEVSERDWDNAKAQWERRVTGK
jgi:hypothetical protein